MMWYRVARADKTTCKWCLSQQGQSDNYRDINFARHEHCRCMIVNTKQGAFIKRAKGGSYQFKAFDNNLQESYKVIANALKSGEILNEYQPLATKVIKQHDDYIRKLSKSSKEMLYDYTSNSNPFNSLFHSSAIKTANKEQLDLIKNMESLLSKRKIGQNVRVTRTISQLPNELIDAMDEQNSKLLNKALNANNIDKKQLQRLNDSLKRLKGESFIQDSFMSATADVNGIFKSSVELRMKVNKNVQGLYVNSISKYKGDPTRNIPSEMELLINLGYKVEITDAKLVETNNGLMVVLNTLVKDRIKTLKDIVK